MSENIDKLLKAKPTKKNGKALLQWIDEIQDQITRGDMMIGILSVEEVKKVPLAYERAIACGEAEAYYSLARWYTDPPIGEPDLSAAEETIRNAISKGLDDAKIRLIEHFWFFRRNDATDEEQKEAYSTSCDLVADKKNDKALYLQGLLTCAGFGTKADPAKAFAIQQKAADLGNTDAMFELFVHWANGLGVDQDDQEAFAANQRAADSGHPRALYNMGAFMASGKYGQKDSKKAFQWYERALEAGNPRALINLAVMCAMGDGVEEDKERAEQLFEEAEAFGFDVSMFKSHVGL